MIGGVSRSDVLRTVASLLPPPDPASRASVVTDHNSFAEPRLLVR